MHRLFQITGVLACLQIAVDAWLLGCAMAVRTPRNRTAVKMIALHLPMLVLLTVTMVVAYRSSR